jgi:hypothetical protein
VRFRHPEPFGEWGAQDPGSRPTRAERGTRNAEGTGGVRGRGPLAGPPIHELDDAGGVGCRDSRLVRYRRLARILPVIAVFPTREVAVPYIPILTAAGVCPIHRP